MVGLMNPTRAFRPAAVVFAAFTLTACSVENDGAMFQRWAEDVKNIPVTEAEAQRQALGAPKPVNIDVVDPIEAVKSEAARRVVAAAEPVVRDVIGERIEAVMPAGRAVQIAAFRSEQEARGAWSDLVDRHRALAGLSPQFETVDLGEKGTWVRLKAGPVPSPEAAAALCAAAGVADAWCARASAS